MEFSLRPNRDTAEPLMQLCKDGEPQVCTDLPPFPFQTMRGVLPKHLPCVSICPKMQFKDVDGHTLIGLTCARTPNWQPFKKEKPSMKIEPKNGDAN